MNAAKVQCQRLLEGLVHVGRNCVRIVRLSQKREQLFLLKHTESLAMPPTACTDTICATPSVSQIMQYKLGLY